MSLLDTPDADDADNAKLKHCAPVVLVGSAGKILLDEEDVGF
jgi:hypothetical protein